MTGIELTQTIETENRGFTAIPMRYGSAEGAVRLLRATLLVLAIMAVTVALLNGLVESLGHSPQFSYTLIGSFAVYVATRPRHRDLTAVVGLGLALRLVYGATYGIKPYFGSAVISSGCFVGIVSLTLMAFKAVRNRSFSEFGIAAYFPFVLIAAGLILPVTNRLSPETFDGHLLAADGVVGFQPSFLVGRLISGHPLLWDLTSAIYYAVPFAVALLCAVQFARRPQAVPRLLWLFATMTVVGFCIYVVCPATGPRYAFSETFPFHVPGADTLSLTEFTVPGAPRNAIPSLHFTTALLVLWNSLAFGKVGRIAAGLFLAATMFAVLALGEHYLIDLVVAVPFSLFFQAAFTETAPAGSRRSAAMWTSAGLVTAWLLMLRLSPEALTQWPVVTCIALGATAVVSLLLWGNLRGGGDLCRT